MEEEDAASRFEDRRRKPGTISLQRFSRFIIEGVLSRIRSLETGGEGRNRVNQLSFGNYCSPLVPHEFMHKFSTSEMEIFQHLSLEGRHIPESFVLKPGCRLQILLDRS
jgi:hypothetical protein